MSYYEIYNDKVFDLFEPLENRTPSGLPLRDNGRKTVVVGLTERPCESLKEFEKLYDQANINRSTAGTKLNAHSSRSHAILCVKVVTTTGDKVRTSIVSAIDLAGSEDNRRADNNKERLVESSAINRSLFVLAQCVEAISKKHNRVPYRESKMTRILSLGQNNGLTVMFLNLAPVRSYHLDTLSSLNFANRTKRIETREVENESIAKGMAGPITGATGPLMQRQPLRQLTETSHNILANAAEDSAKAASKRIKAFSVYADKSRLSSEVARHHVPKRSSPLKRPSDPLTSNLRRPKVPRVNEPTVSKAAIENMVEKKVAEILALRTVTEKPPPTASMSEEIKKRLDALEQRIENQGEGKSEGLTFLLMAKQHQAHGEDSSALKMYELAQEYFPENTKLASKIAKLKQKIDEKKDSTRQDSSSGLMMHQAPVLPAEPRDLDADDEEYAPVDEDCDSDAEQPLRRKPKRLRTVHPLPDLDIEPARTPRSLQLLRIINSRDVARIRLLRGVGAKKAEAIVAALCTAGEDEREVGGLSGGPLVGSLGELGRLKGVGAKTVENMRCGLAVEGSI